MVLAALSAWFSENYMILHAYKCQFLTARCKEPFPDFSFNDKTIENVTEEKIFGILINTKPNLRLI